jgi:hypothetical protein
MKEVGLIAITYITYILIKHKKSFEGIVSRDFGVLFISSDRYEV